MEKIRNDELHQILDKVNLWIGNCDAKTTAILGGFGVCASIFLTSNHAAAFASTICFAKSHIDISSGIYLGVCFLALTMIIYGICLLVFVLVAKIDPKEFVRPGVKTESLVFFSSIAKHKNALDYRRKLRECTPEQMQEDLISQIYICSLICDQKFDLYNSGVKSLIAGLIMYFLIFLVGQMLVP